MKPSCQRVLQALYDAHPNGLTAVQLAHPTIGALDYRKRISELRKEGWDIKPHRVEGKPYSRYFIVGRPA